jgi:TP901-1 family phage major tail protein
MAAQSGKSIVVQFKDDATPTPAFQTIGGLRSRSISFNGETVDITNAGSTGNWRELLAGVGVRSVSISGDGVFVDDAAAAEMKDAFFENEFRDANFLVPDFGTFAGSFQVTSLEFGGDYNREVTFSATFESAGEITFTAA